jgi:hypothetical protein
MLAIILAGLLAGGGAAPMKMNPLMMRNPPPENIMDLTLPTGPLAPIGGDAHSFGFIDLDRTQVQPGNATAVLFYAYDPGPQLDESTVVKQSVERVVIDCRSDEKMDLGRLGFDKDDVLVIWLPRRTEWDRVIPEGMLGLVKQALCNGGIRPRIGFPVGHAAAVRLARDQMRMWAADNGR